MHCVAALPRAAGGERGRRGNRDTCIRRLNGSIAVADSTENGNIMLSINFIRHISDSRFCLASFQPFSCPKTKRAVPVAVRDIHCEPENSRYKAVKSEVKETKESKTSWPKASTKLNQATAMPHDPVLAREGVLLSFHQRTLSPLSSLTMRIKSGVNKRLAKGSPRRGFHPTP